MVTHVGPCRSSSLEGMVAAAYQRSFTRSNTHYNKGVAMQRLPRILVALGGAMAVACSAEPPVGPTVGAKPASGTPDPKLVAMSNVARGYLTSLIDGSAGTTLTAA